MKESTFKLEVRSQRGFEIIFVLLLHFACFVYIYKVEGVNLPEKQSNNNLPQIF